VFDVRGRIIHFISEKERKERKKEGGRNIDYYT
jgi:hypothetical protein